MNDIIIIKVPTSKSKSSASINSIYIYFRNKSLPQPLVSHRRPKYTLQFTILSFFLLLRYALRIQNNWRIHCYLKRRRRRAGKDKKDSFWTRKTVSVQSSLTIQYKNNAGRNETKRHHTKTTRQLCQVKRDVIRTIVFHKLPFNMVREQVTKKMRNNINNSMKSCSCLSLGLADRTFFLAVIFCSGLSYSIRCHRNTRPSPACLLWLCSTLLTLKN